MPSYLSAVLRTVHIIKIGPIRCVSAHWRSQEQSAQILCQELGTMNRCRNFTFKVQQSVAINRTTYFSLHYFIR